MSLIVTDENLESLDGYNLTGITLLDCDKNRLESLPDLPDTLIELYCNENQLTELPDLESQCPVLEELYCTENKLTSLPNLPETLKKLDCTINSLKKLPALPEMLKKLFCSQNQLITLPKLDHCWDLQTIYCNQNRLKSLPTLPSSLVELYCSLNKLTSLPDLLGCKELKILHCTNSLLKTLPTLLHCKSLKDLYCYGNELTSIPPLPPSLEGLFCSNNNLTKLPILPWSLGTIESDFGNDADQIKCNQYNEAAEHLGLPLLDVDEFKNTMTQENYEAVVYLDKKKQVRRFTDLAMVFPTLPPYVLAEIATHESPTVPAFDVYQMGAFMSSAQKQISGRSNKKYKMKTKKYTKPIE